MNIGGDLLQFSTVSPLNATTQESQVLEQDVDQFDLSARTHKSIFALHEPLQIWQTLCI